MSGDAEDKVSDMRSIFEVVRGAFRTRYVGLLEGEVVRLRGENHALMNSLLGTAGFPPVDFQAAVKQPELPRVRKRSWHQTQLRKEIEAGKTFPE